MGIDSSLSAFGFQPFHPAIRRVFCLAVAALGRPNRQIFRCKLCFMSRFHAHVFLFHLTNFVMDGQISGTPRLECALRHRIFRSAWFYLILKTQRMAHLAGYSVKLAVDTGPVFLG